MSVHGSAPVLFCGSTQEYIQESILFINGNHVHECTRITDQPNRQPHNNIIRRLVNHHGFAEPVPNGVQLLPSES